MDKNRRFQHSGFLFRALLLLIFLLCPFIIAFAQWEDAEITRLTENVSLNGMLSLIIGKDDKLFLLYIEYPPGLYGGRYQTLLMTKEKGKEWSEPEAIGDTCYSSLSRCPIFYIDPQTEVIHLLYYDTDKIYYSNSQRENWEKDLIDSGYVYSGKMAFDSLGNVHLSLGKQWVSAGEHYVKYYYVTNQSGEWIQQAISPDIFTGPYGYVAVHWIEAEREGVVHIVYVGSYYYKHARNNALGGTTWTTRYIPPPPGAYDSYWISSFGLDRSGRLHTTIYTYLYEPRRHREFYYPWVDDTGWAEPEEITNTGSVEDLFIDRDGDVHIVWSRISGDINDRDMYYAYKEGDQWHSYQILDHTERYSDSRFHFVIDSEGKGHAAFAGIYYEPPYVPDSTEIYYMVGSPTAVPEAKQGKQIANFILLQNYPNPFNTSTLIPFTVSGKRLTANSTIPTTQQSVNSSQLMVHSPLHTTLVIYNILGEKVRTLMYEEKFPGEYRVMWDGKDETGKEVASGVYFYRLKVGVLSLTKKLVLIK